MKKISYLNVVQDTYFFKESFTLFCMEQTSEETFVTKDMTVGEVIDMYPETTEIVFEYGLHCVGCGIAAIETIEQGAMGHGMSPDDVDMLVRDLNRIIRETRDS